MAHTRQKRKQPPSLDGEFLETVRQPILRVWRSIGPDVSYVATDNQFAIDACIDSYRLISIAKSPPAFKAVDRETRRRGRRRVVSYLNRHIHLI